MTRYIPDDIMDLILAECGQHTSHDPHYHCAHCGGKVHYTEHCPDPRGTFTCEAHPEAVDALNFGGITT